MNAICSRIRAHVCVRSSAPLIQHRKTSAGGSFWWPTAGRCNKRQIYAGQKFCKFTESCLKITDMTLVISRSYLTLFVILRPYKTRFDKRETESKRERDSFPCFEQRAIVAGHKEMRNLSSVCERQTGDGHIGASFIWKKRKSNNPSFCQTDTELLLFQRSPPDHRHSPSNRIPTLSSRRWVLHRQTSLTRPAEDKKSSLNVNYCSKVVGKTLNILLTKAAFIIKNTAKTAKMWNVITI